MIAAAVNLFRGAHVGFVLAREGALALVDAGQATAGSLVIVRVTDEGKARRFLERNPQLMADIIAPGSDGRASDAGAPLRGLVTFLAFVVFGFAPLLPYVLLGPAPATFPFSVAATLAMLIIRPAGFFGKRAAF